MHAIRSQDRSYLRLMTERWLLVIHFFLVWVAVIGQWSLCDNSSCTWITCTLFHMCYTAITKLTKKVPVDLGPTSMLLTTAPPCLSSCPSTVGAQCQWAQRGATASEQGCLFLHETFQDCSPPTQTPPPPPLNL